MSCNCSKCQCGCSCNCGCSCQGRNKINFCLLKSYLEDVRGWKCVVDPCSRRRRKPKTDLEEQNEDKFITISLKKEDN